MKKQNLFFAIALTVMFFSPLFWRGAGGEVFAQNIGINSTGAAPNASAILDIDGTNGGLLIPRMTTADRTLIASPVNSLMIYNTTDNCLQIYGSGSSTWQNIYCICAAAPAAPGSITGTTPICENATGISYFIAAVTGATSYTWAAPAGATITSGQGTTSIFVNFGSSSGNISVTASNSCGTSAANTLAITISASPTTANAGPGQSTCGNSATLAGNTPTVGTGLWTIESGTGGSFTGATIPATLFTGTSGTTYILRWTISNPPCTASSDTVTIGIATDNSSTVLLLHMDDNTFPDAHTPAHPVTVMDNTVSTTPAKFGQSGYFDGALDYLSVPDHADWDFGIGNFTIDFWFQLNCKCSPQGEQTFISHYIDNNNNWRFSFDETNGLWFGKISGGVVTQIGEVGKGLDYSIGTWYHAALVRSGATVKIYANGVEKASGALSGWVDYSSSLKIGHNDTGGYPLELNGYLDELRISKGCARWTSNFTPPANPYCD